MGWLWSANHLISLRKIYFHIFSIAWVSLTTLIGKKKKFFLPYFFRTHFFFEKERSSFINASTHPPPSFLVQKSYQKKKITWKKFFCLRFFLNPPGQKTEKNIFHFSFPQLHLIWELRLSLQCSSNSYGWVLNTSRDTVIFGFYSTFPLPRIS